MRALIALVFLTVVSCSGAPSADTAQGEDALLDQAKALQKKADDNVNATIKKIGEEARVEQDVQAEKSQAVEGNATIKSASLK